MDEKFKTNANNYVATYIRKLGMAKAYVIIDIKSEEVKKVFNKLLYLYAKVGTSGAKVCSLFPKQS